MPGMKWIEPTVFSKSSGNPIFRQIFGHQMAKNEARNTKISRGQETHPIRRNARYEMNWANVFFFSKSSGNLVYRRTSTVKLTASRTDKRTDGQTSGWIQYTPIPPSVEWGYNDTTCFFSTIDPLLIGPLRTNFSEILFKYKTSHSQKCIWKYHLQLAAILSRGDGLNKLSNVLSKLASQHDQKS